MNNDLGLPPFYVGQKVVALTDSVDGWFKKGKVYQIKKMKKCCDWLIDIGFILPSGFIQKCTYCMDIISYQRQIRWNGCRFFAPLESTFTAITFKEVIEIEQPLISVQ